jgi:phosphoglycerol transferase MdoB-like AlkP superfamily enzyme
MSLRQETEAPRLLNWNTTAIARNCLVCFHAAAVMIMYATERTFVSYAAFIAGWVILNATFLLLVRRPNVAALCALVVLVSVVEISKYKFDMLGLTANFVDLVIVDLDTAQALLQIEPKLGQYLAVICPVVLLFGVFIWRLEVARPRRRTIVASLAGAAVVLVALDAYRPADPRWDLNRSRYFSKFARSSVAVITDLSSTGLFDKSSDTDLALSTSAASCSIDTASAPHIIVVHDESSFDARSVKSIRLPENYGNYFKSFDGVQRTLFVEGAGGPSWYTEYNVFTGLSVSSFGKFKDQATRLAAGRVKRGLPRVLADCGYRTFSLYSMNGMFLSAKRFQETAGIQTFIDAKQMGTRNFFEPDRFYFDRAADLLREHGTHALTYIHVYLAQNHSPWTVRYQPDRLPSWRDPGNEPMVDEYLRRQKLTEEDYRQFLLGLEQNFPKQKFLVVRFGDHQPPFARRLIDPEGRIKDLKDLRFLSTYYAIDTVGFKVRSLDSALEQLDAPYLPNVVLEAAGIPLDPSFALQRTMLHQCGGQFETCQRGREVRRFNKALSDAGYIAGL